MNENTFVVEFYLTDRNIQCNFMACVRAMQKALPNLVWIDYRPNFHLFLNGVAEICNVHCCFHIVIHLKTKALSFCCTFE